MSDYCSLFSQTFYGLLFSYLTITDVTSYVHHKLSVSFLLYIATKKTCQINQIITVNSSMNAPISETYCSQKITLAHLACLCLTLRPWPERGSCSTWVYFIFFVLSVTRPKLPLGQILNHVNCDVYSPKHVEALIHG